MNTNPPSPETLQSWENFLSENDQLISGLGILFLRLLYAEFLYTQTISSPMLAWVVTMQQDGSLTEKDLLTVFKEMYEAKILPIDGGCSKPLRLCSILKL